jgi:hypothetical protein
MKKCNPNFWKKSHKIDLITFLMRVLESLLSFTNLS